MACLILGFAFLGSPVRANVLATYSADVGEVIQNPTEQGWEETGLGNGVVVEGVVADGTNAWRIVDDASNLNPRYGWALTAEDFQAMYDQGWTYTFVVRGVTAGFSGWGISTANDPGWGLTGRERVGFGITVSGGAFNISPIHGSPVDLGPGSANDFHTIRCLGKAQSSEYEFFIDGESYGTYDIKDGGSNVNYDDVLRFVSGSTGGTGRETLWNFVGLGKGKLRLLAPELATDPTPGDAVTDVPRNVVLGWQPGDFAVTHDVYLGTVFEDVNAASMANPLDVLVSQGQTDTSYDAGTLKFGQTHYWRVDEVNGAPDNTVFKGDVWSFEVEPYSYPIEAITATASSSHDADMVPGKTIDGSGLDALDQHSNDAKDMWLSGAGIQPVWIQYAFDQAYKLHELWVWNSNQSIESFVGLGAKDVTIETSTNGTDWTQLEDIPPFAQAPGQAGYAHNTVIDLDGVVAQYVKLTIDAGYGMLPQSGLSEVRFFYVPTYAREAQPADGDTADTVDVVLNWRAGREAASHEVYLGTDPMDLTLAQTVEDSSAAIGPLDYDTTYFWQIVEVNDAEDPTSYASDVWRFSTPAYGIVDDFEPYDNDCHRIFFAWLDGLGHNGGEGIEDCDVAPYNGNGTGSIVGHGTSPFAEQTIVYAGRQSMPLEYSSAVSETTIALDPQDWTTGGIQTLSFLFYGAPGNTGQLYLKINNTKVSYMGLAHALQRQQWVPWNIELAATGANLTNVTSLTLGIEGASAPGMIYVDEIRLYPLAPETIEPVLPNDSDPALVAYYEFEGNANDSVGSYHGTVEGDPVYTAGKMGQAISLDEINDHVVHALAQEELWSGYTLSLWAKTDLMGQDLYSGLFNNNSSSADFQIEVNGNDTYLYRGSATGAFGPVSSDWVHLTATCDGVQTRLYYNGLQVGTLDIADTRFGQLAVGINRGMSNRFGGTIDEVRVYNRALSAGEGGGLAGITDSIPKAF